MVYYSKTLARILKHWPGKSLGIYRFLPVFFFMGAVLEFSMINWQVRDVNFYRVYKRKRVQEMVEEALHQS